MIDSIASVLTWFEWFVLGYFLSLNTIYLLLTLLAVVGFTKHIRRSSHAGHDAIFANPLTPGVSMIVAAYNEEAGIVDSVRAMLSLRYPKFEVVVVEDGSTDATFERLDEAFDLAEIPWSPPQNALQTVGRVLSVHVSRSGEPLTVVRKTNGGSRADASNVGINVARMPLFCMVDADSILDPEGLLRVAKPFVDDPARVVASGGVILPGNGCVVEQGQVVESKLPKSWLARVQFVEYLRSFLMGRTGWSALQSVLVISGAFGMFRRDVVIEVGGLDHTSVGEDAELVASIHQQMRRQGRDYRIVFVAEPVCWTETPEDKKVLGRQRRRWSRGLAEVLWKHKSMFLNPRYGRIGLLTMPYYLMFELLGPFVELIGFLSVAVALIVGVTGNAMGHDWWLVNTEFLVLFGIVALGYSILLSAAALAAEEFSFHRLSSWKDLGVAFAASIIENVGYRQLHAWWRIKGVIWWATRRSSSWGAMPRSGFVAQRTKVS